MTRLAGFTCMVCNTRHVKDNTQLGDYYSTEKGYLLQSYCPNCGRMEPLISGSRMSRKEMKNYAHKIAMEFNLDFGRCRSLAKTSDGTDFVSLFSKEFNLNPDDVTSLHLCGSDENAFSHPRANSF